MKKTGHGLGKGVLNAVEERLTSKEFNQKTKDFVNALLFAQASQDVLELGRLLQIADNVPEQLTNEDINKMKQLVEDLISSTLINENEKGELEALSFLINPIEDLPEDPNAIVRKNFNTDKELVHKSAVTLSGFIARQQGSLVNAVDFLKKAVLDPEQGILKQADIQLTTAEDSMLKNALRILTQTLFGLKNQELAAQQGIAGGLSQMLAESVIGNELAGKKTGIVPGTISLVTDHLKRKTHPLLPQLKEAVEQCKKALAQNKDAVPFAKQAHTLIEQIIQEKDTVFPPASSITEADFKMLTSIERYFHNIEDTNPFIDHYPFTVAHLERVEGFVGKLCAEHQNVVELAADILLKKINPILDRAEEFLGRVEKLLPTMLQNAKQALGVLDTAPADGASQAGAMGGFLDSVGGMFKQMLSKGAAAVSKEALGSVASLIITFIQKVHEKIDPQFDDQRTALNQLIDRINQFKDQPAGITFDRLRELFIDLVKICDTMNICFSGLYLPHFTDPDDVVEDAPSSVSGSKPRIDAYQNIQLLESAHEDLTTPVKEDWETLAKKEKDKFIEKTTDFITLQYIYESICHRQPNKIAYLTLMENAKKLNAPSLQRLIINDIKAERNVPWYTVWKRIIFAWVIYQISHSLIQTFIKRASNAFFEEAFQYIKDQKNRNFEDFTNARISNANNYLTILNSAFESLPKIEPAYGDLPTMLKKEMEDPRRNRFHTVDEICTEFAGNVIRKGTSNRLLIWIAKKILPKKIKSVVDSVFSSLHSADGYAYAFDKVIVDLLQDVEKLIRSSGTSQIKKAGSDPLAEPRKKALGELVQNLFQILEKSRCNGIKGLRNLADGKNQVQSLFDIIKQRLQEILHLDINDLVVQQMMENSTFVVADAMRMLGQEDQLQKLTYNFIQLLNQTYEIESVDEQSPQEKQKRQRMEARVQELSTNILRESISQAIDERADTMKEQGEVNAAIVDLRKKTNEWIFSAGNKLEELSEMDSSSDREAFRLKIAALYDEKKAFQHQLDQTKLSITNNHWQVELNKNVVIQRIESIEAASHDLAQMIKDMEREMYLLEARSGLTPHLQNICDALTAIDDSLDSSLTVHLPQLNAIEQVLNNGEILKNLKLFILPAERDRFIKNLKDQLKDLSSALREMDQLNAQRTLLRDLFEGEDFSFINQIIAAKRANAPVLKSLCSSIEQRILKTLPEDKRQRFISALRSLVNLRANSPEEGTQQELFETLCKETLQEANDSFAARAQIAQEHREKTRSAIDGTALLNPDYVSERIKTVENNLDTSMQRIVAFQEKCKKTLTDVPFVNINLINPKTFKKHAKRIVFDTAKGYIDELHQFVTREDTGPSLIRHMAMMPYNRYQWECVGGDGGVPVYARRDGSGVIFKGDPENAPSA